MEDIYYGLIAACCLLALVNWRLGLYVGLFIDVLRDPIRKISEEQSVAITLAGALVWGCVLIAGVAAHQSEWRMLFRRYAQLRLIGVCVVLAIVPAALLSTLLYPRGYVLAAMGIASYVVPLCTIALGFVCIRDEREIYRLLRFYSLINAIMLLSVPLEYFGSDVPGLGGIKTEWIRYRGGGETDVKLIAGWYRSPDIMGLHAAHVMMFSAMLAIRGRPTGRIGWLALMAWAGYGLLLCGRRKMIGIPLVFVAAYSQLSAMQGMYRARRMLGFGIALLLLVVAGGLTLWEDSLGDEYGDYAASIFTESHTRINDLVIGSAIGTLQQAGVLGAGLGTAMQGRYYVNVNTSRDNRGWQEDGLSKMLLEFGLPGLLLMLLAGAALVSAMFAALRLVRPGSSVLLLQIGLMSVVAGDAASFVISHQQFSGDPVSGMLVMIMVGIVLGAPRAFAL
ncbi:MAG: hypothetical protein KDA75_00940, partial [Planctomycetaceae bacterium]|nr:hypothetical protein [Planctomycetaceae bacterium]